MSFHGGMKKCGRLLKIIRTQMYETLFHTFASNGERVPLASNVWETKTLRK